MKKKWAKFNLGDGVIHKDLGYRAIVIDVDPVFFASGHYNPLTKNKKFANKHPWYRLLVEDCKQTTYVEENKLMPSDDPKTHRDNMAHTRH